MTVSGRVLVLVLVLVKPVAGCEQTAPPVATQPTSPPTTGPIKPGAPVTKPAPVKPTPAPPAGPQIPVGAIDLPCTVRAEIQAKITDASVTLTYVLQNIGPDEAKVMLRGNCFTFVNLGGLSSGYDPTHSCNKGICRNPDRTATFTIPGGRKLVEIGSTTLHAKGGGCNPPLPMGSTFFQANIVTEPKRFDVCSGAQVHVVRDHASGKLRQAGLLDSPVPATLPAKPTPAKVTPTKVTPTKVTPTKVTPTKPQPTTTKPKNCPICGFACVNGGVPSRRTDANGCPICGCDDDGPRL